jgi:hypothetical protein
MGTFLIFSEMGTFLIFVEMGTFLISSFRDTRVGSSIAPCEMRNVPISKAPAIGCRRHRKKERMLGIVLIVLVGPLGGSLALAADLPGVMMISERSVSRLRRSRCTGCGASSPCPLAPGER